MFPKREWRKEQEIMNLVKKSAKEEDPLVEFAHEPDAETEPGANVGDPIPAQSNDLLISAMEGTAEANLKAEISWQAASSHSLGAALTPEAPHSSYPPEYDPFDRPVGEVVAQLFDDTQPVNPPPAKRQR